MKLAVLFCVEMPLLWATVTVSGDFLSVEVSARSGRSRWLEKTKTGKLGEKQRVQRKREKGGGGERETDWEKKRENSRRNVQVYQFCNDNFTSNSDTSQQS